VDLKLRGRICLEEVVDIHYGGVRRHADGSIDVGYYRRRAARLRAHALHAALERRIVPLARPLAGAAALALALFLMPAADGHGWNGPKPNGSCVAPDWMFVADEVGHSEGDGSVSE
jgi:hypothetical protein